MNDNNYNMMRNELVLNLRTIVSDFHHPSMIRLDISIDYPLTQILFDFSYRLSIFEDFEE